MTRQYKFGINPSRWRWKTSVTVKLLLSLRDRGTGYFWIVQSQQEVARLMVILNMPALEPRLLAALDVNAMEENTRCLHLSDGLGTQAHPRATNYSSVSYHEHCKGKALPSLFECFKYWALEASHSLPNAYSTKARIVQPRQERMHR